MSKRKSAGSSNTLFNYFNKSPSTKRVKLNSNNTLDNSTVNREVDAALAIDADQVSSPNNLKHQNDHHDLPDEDEHNGDGEEEVMTRPKKKFVRIRAAIESDESDTGNEEVATHKKKKSKLNLIESDDSDTENKADNEIKTPKALKKLHDSFTYEPNQSAKSDTPIKSSTKNRSDVQQKISEPQENAALDDRTWVHCKLDWLKPDKIRDAQKRRPDHPDYDPTTLYVPPSFYQTQTPAHRQWWEMKSAYFDCVLFFKVGKFYELYHMDAGVGVKELGFSYMKGDFAHSGFPESAYARMASTLVAKGYKVARVEQTETPEMMQERCKKMSKGKADKVVRREICQVTVRGTQVCGVQDPGPGEPSATYMIAVAEEEGSQGFSTYGVCFVDTSIGHFHLGQFKDDKHSSRLLTTLAHYPPALIIFDRKTTTTRTRQLLSSHCHNARREAQALWTPEKTLKTLAEKYYKTNEDGDWPEGIKPFLHEGDALGLTAAPNSYLALKALGGCVAYLTECLVDIQVLGMSQFTNYTPPDVQYRAPSQEQRADNKWEGGSTMVLDAITLKNLRIVRDEGCLYDKLNFCATAMGKRLLHQWVCAPSSNLNVIEERQKAIQALYQDQELWQEAKDVLKKLPDLERLLAKVHALGNLVKSRTHPDSRAIMYEDKIYSKRKVIDFLAILSGFETAMKLVSVFEDTDAVLLKRITQLNPNGRFPDYKSTLEYFRGAFNHAEAESAGRILPKDGVDEEYDGTVRLIKEIEDDLNKCLTSEEAHFRCRLKFVGTDRKRYQIEVPEKAAVKADYNYRLEGARKGYKKFSTEETRELLARMISAEEEKSKVLKDYSRRIFENFSSHYNKWEAAVQCVATLDVLVAFAEFARQQSGEVCLPQVTFDKDRKPYINIVEGRHPCISIVNDFIPNDTQLGTEEGSLLLLTGPNMGGKSTLMRQVGLLTVLAHLGSFVPAQECSVSLVDRIFTRLGATDDILSGQSTFLVEMNETAAIVRHCTVHSLVLLDELGRGTSTYDGMAIASGVCAALAERGTRVVFSTHYHALVHQLGTRPGVVLGHMACMVETDESVANNEDHIPEETITFLYKLTPGACPKSYGFNAARLAGIPTDIIRRAHQVARELEKDTAYARAFREILVTDVVGVRDVLSRLSI